MDGIVSTSPWSLGWLTPARARGILVATLLAAFAIHVWYLKNTTVLDLTGDEAQYWDWSRQLELSYYSKGPLVAYIIRASTSIFGNTMIGVRLPALLLAIASAICIYGLTKKLFGSERLALGTVLLIHVIPLFVAGSLLMTIDAPFFFCWALASWLAACAVFDDRKNLWPWIGVVVGVGFLAKYAMFLWLLLVLLFLIVDAPSRQHLKSIRFWLMPIIAVAFTTPVIVWNAQHGWASYYHVSEQTGVSNSDFSWTNLPELIGGQIGVIGPITAVLMTAAVVWAITDSPAPNLRRPIRFLLSLSLPFFLLCVGLTFLKKVQGNWPGPTYFGLVILTGLFLSTRLESIQTWKPWRPWFYTAIVTGLAMVILVHDLRVLYPFAPMLEGALNDTAKACHLKTRFNIKPRNIDPTAKFRGFALLGERVNEELATMPADTIIIGDDYQLTAELAFYVKGNPKTFCVGSYFINGKRLTQYDMWPDRALDQDALKGRSAIYVGKERDEVRNAFAQMTGRLTRDGMPSTQPIVLVVDDDKSKTFRIWRCTGFRGMTRPSEGRAH